MQDQSLLLQDKTKHEVSYYRFYENLCRNAMDAQYCCTIANFACMPKYDLNDDTEEGRVGTCTVTIFQLRMVWGI